MSSVPVEVYSYRHKGATTVCSTVSSPKILRDIASYPKHEIGGNVRQLLTQDQIRPDISPSLKTMGRSNKSLLTPLSADDHYALLGLKPPRSTSSATSQTTLRADVVVLCFWKPYHWIRHSSFVMRRLYSLDPLFQSQMA